MPSVLPTGRRSGPSPHTRGAQDNENDSYSRVHPSQADEDAIAELHRTVTGRTEPESPYPEPHSSFHKFLKQENRAREDSGLPLGGLGVSFRNVTTWGEGDGHSDVKTLADAVWRTLTLQDIWEWTLKRWIAPPKLQNGRPLIKDFSGIVRRGEIMLVLGRPGSGCSTFLRTVANNHSPFLGVTGSINYSGLDSATVSKHYRGEVAYIPEEDVHFPTLTVRQTLEFALQAKTPKRYRHHIPQMLEMYARVFGISHVMNTLVGNEYIRGVSGGERKRISIIESLAADSSVISWDNSTRGLDAAAAVDYARSLRIMTDACGKATIVALYQASEAVYELVDKVLLIDDGRIIYQGPANKAKQYFEELGYECAERQTTADFLTSITLPDERNFRDGWEAKAPKGAIELEETFRRSPAFEDVERDISEYEKQSLARSEPPQDPNLDSRRSSLEYFKTGVQSKKSRFVSSKSPYNTSFARQVFLCTKRQWWQLKGHLAPLYAKLISALVSAFLIGSQFYDQPATTNGVFSRGGFLFYSAIIIAWLQMAELEEAIQGRDILSRQKRTAFVRPSAVGIARVFIDLIVVLLETLVYTIVSYFLAGMKMEPGPFFIYVLFLYTCSIAMTAQYRLFAAVSPSFEVAIRYAGISVLVCIIYGGYVLSIGRLISDVPWVGWLAYATPALYTYEAVMAAEFHGRNFTCSEGSIIPFGPNYTDVQYQSCAYAGSKPGGLDLNGDDYVAAQFDFYYGNVWRNFGILLLFSVGFVLISSWLSEAIEWDTGSTGPVQYKKKWPKISRVAKKKRNDEEKSAVQLDHQAPPAHRAGGLATRDSTAQGLMKSRSLFSWEDLRYSIKAGKEEKLLLNDVSGYCKPGQMTALVGSSGAGKSTLLTILTNRQNIGELSGTILIDGNPIDSSFDRKIGYCQQMDIHDESATIREAFEFSALLRQNAEVTKEDRLAYVDTVLGILELSGIQNAIIGSLQLEQKKRVTIGVELCAKPELLLFLDEPTSGLDSQSALGIVSLLRKLADAGQAILCTIHQANQQQIELFDRVLALNPGGNVYYFGDVGHHGSSIFKYFNSHDVSIPPNKNAADFLIEVGVGAIVSKTDPDRDWSETWRTSPEADSISEYITEIRTSAKPPPPISSSLYSSTILQIRLLTKRTFLQYYRTPEYPYSRLYGSIVHSLLNGLTYLSAGSSLTTTSLQSKAFSSFLVLMLVPEFVNATSMRFISNRSLYLARESPSRTYTWISFCTSQILPELPFAVVGGLFFYVLFYFLVGFPMGTPAGYTFLMTILFHLFTTSAGQWIAALSLDSIIAANLMPLFVIMCELFNGILRPHAQMAAVWKYTMYYVSPFTYWIGGVLSIVLSGQAVRCDESELSFFNAPEGESCGAYAAEWIKSGVTGYLSNPESVGEGCGYCQYSVADDYLSTLDLGPSKPWPYLGIFVAFTISNYMMVYAMFYLVSVKRIFGKGRAG